MNYDHISWIPYEELDIQINGQQISLKTPWMVVNGRLESDATEFAQDCLVNLRNPSAQHTISQFLKPFHRYPLSYWGSSEINNDQFRLYLLSRLRRFRLIENSKTKPAPRPYSAEILKMMVRQNLYITSQCDSILEKAAIQFPAVTNELNEYRKEEYGHELLIERCVVSIEASNLPVLPDAEKIIKIFTDSIQISFLAFCACLDFFEGIRYSGAISPLAVEIEKHFGAEAARPLQIHYDINRKHDHDQIAFSLLSTDPIASSNDEYEKSLRVVRDLMAADKALITKLSC
jgi:hypothetical protein